MATAHTYVPAFAPAPARPASHEAESQGFSLPVRFVATAVAGSALAAAGQMALSNAIPADGTTILHVAADALFSPGTATAALAVTPTGAGVDAVAAAAVDGVVTAPAVAVIAPELVVADGAALVKAAELNAAAVEAEIARVAEEARVAAEAAAAEQAAAAVAASAPARGASVSVAASGGVQMITGSVTSGFGARWGTQHQGLDVAASIGTPIYAPLGGTVISAGAASGFGQWVRIQHDDGTVTVYGHVSAIYVGVGEQVDAGEEIAAVGNEGRSTGPHLHFEVVSPGGTKINPRPWLDERGIGLT